jgi:tRNA(Ile)-lysidine synthase
MADRKLQSPETKAQSTKYKVQNSNGQRTTDNGQTNPHSALRTPHPISRFAFSLLQEWERLGLPLKDARIVVGVSGGADSVALFLALCELIREEKLSFDLIVAHFNHGLRDEAKEDAEWVRHLVEEFKIQNSKLKITDGKVQSTKTKDQRPKIESVFGEGDVLKQSKQTKDNLEQAARQARYEFLFDVAFKKEASIIVTAHTMDDQAETFLLNLLRGSGTEGLGGIEPVSSPLSVAQNRETQSKIENRKSKSIRNPQSAIRNPLLVRPLLGWAKRADTENFCRERGIDFRIDAMNEDVRFARVRVRKELLPLMETFNGRIVETLSRTAEILREDDKELNSQAEELLTEARAEKETSTVAPLRVSVLLNASVGLRRRALRLWIERGKGDLRRVGMAHILQVESLLKGEQGGRIIELPKGCLIERRKGLIWFHSKKG